MVGRKTGEVIIKRASYGPRQTMDNQKGKYTQLRRSLPYWPQNHVAWHVAIIVAFTPDETYGGQGSVCGRS
jgi:hypothetical protein